MLRLSTCLLLALLTTACAQLPHYMPGEPERAQAAGQTTHLDQVIAPFEARHSGQSAFRLVSDGFEAFALRLHSARSAERSLDVQTYIWHPDLTGGYLAHALLLAADRGVKVRLLVDDMDARQKHYAFAALAAHPNISVRLFNPFASRSGLLGKLGEASQRFDQLNQRMHNKTWVADNRLAIAGGRNLGDEYFGASETVNFVDLDLAMIGPVVRDISASFDRYWNAPVSYPVALLAPEDVNNQALTRLRGRLNQHNLSARTSRYAQTLRQDQIVKQLVLGHWPMRWTANYRFVSDDPLKVRGRGQGINGSEVLARLLPAGEAARESLWVLSPYFVPGQRGEQTLIDLERQGHEVRLVTNSLAANDVIAVHSGYRRYREGLLAGGVELWELKPLFMRKPRASLFGSSGASLHTKALVIDGEQIFVGSFNLDPRSTSLNTEQGVLLHEPQLGHEMQQLFERQANPERAWKVSLEDGRLSWQDADKRYDTEPQASLSKRFLSWFVGLLPVERHL